MKANSNLSEIELRIKTISELLIKGVSYLDIMALTDEYKVSRRTIANYLAKAKELIIESNKTNIEVESSKLKQRYELLFNMALETGDLRTANSILAQQSKMFGLSEPKENIDDGTIKIIHSFTGVQTDGHELNFIDNNDNELDFSL